MKRIFIIGVVVVATTAALIIKKKSNKVVVGEGYNEEDKKDDIDDVLDERFRTSLEYMSLLEKEPDMILDARINKKGAFKKLKTEDGQKIILGDYDTTRLKFICDTKKSKILVFFINKELKTERLVKYAALQLKNKAYKFTINRCRDISTHNISTSDFIARLKASQKMESTNKVSKKVSNKVLKRYKKNGNDRKEIIDNSNIFEYANLNEVLECRTKARRNKYIPLTIYM